MAVSEKECHENNKARVRREINITRASEALLWTVVTLASQPDTVLLLSLRVSTFSKSERRLCGRMRSSSYNAAILPSPGPAQRTEERLNDRSSSGSQRSELKIKAAAMITEEAADAVARLPSLFLLFPVRGPHAAGGQSGSFKRQLGSRQLGAFRKKYVRRTGRNGRHAKGATYSIKKRVVSGGRYSSSCGPSCRRRRSCRRS